MLFSKFLLIGSPRGVILVLGAVTAPLLLTSMLTNSVFVNGNNIDAYAQAGQETRPFYFIRINPSSEIEGSQHYSIGNAAVPAGTAVVWVNNDQGVRHTVTSGSPGNNTGLFDSGEMPFNAQYQLDFRAGGLIGEFTYYCTLHPHMVAQISASDTVESGQSFEFRPGTGSTLDISKNNRTLLTFTPIGMSTDQPDVMHYNFSITRNSDNQTLFAQEFDVENNVFGIELIQASQSEAQALGINIPLWFGPDVDNPYTGAYHAAGDFFSQPGDYTLGVELMTIGANPPPQPMRDEFTMSAVSGATATNATAP